MCEITFYFHIVKHKNLIFLVRCRGTGVKGLMRGMATLPQGYQELLMVRDKDGRPPDELGVSKSMEYDISPLQCFDTVGWATGRASGL